MGGFFDEMFITDEVKIDTVHICSVKSYLTLYDCAFRLFFILAQRDPWEDLQKISFIIPGWFAGKQLENTVILAEVLVDSHRSSISPAGSCRCFHVGRSVRKYDTWQDTTQNDLPLQWRGSGTLLRLGLENAPKEVAYQAGGSRKRRTHRCYSIHWPDSFYRHTGLSWEH